MGLARLLGNDVSVVFKTLVPLTSLSRSQQRQAATRNAEAGPTNPDPSWNRLRLICMPASDWTDPELASDWTDPELGGAGGVTKVFSFSPLMPTHGS